MDVETVRAYIGHRLAVAGAKEGLFSPSAADLVYQYTGGVPRLVNQLCDLAMVYAYTKDEHLVVSGTVKQVLEDGVFFAARPPVEPSAVFQSRQVKNQRAE